MLSDALDFHDFGLECVAVESAGLELIAVGVDGVDRIVEYAGDAAAVVYAHAHEGEDAEVGVHTLAIFEDDGLVGL